MTVFATRTTFVTLILIGLSVPSLAQADTPEELAKIYACRAIIEDAERLACFDANVGTLQAAEETGEVVALSKETIQTTRREGFGLDLSGLTRLGGIFGSSNKDDDGTPKTNALTPTQDTSRSASIETNDDGEVTRVTYAISKTRKFGYQRMSFELENGQVWNTIEAEDIRIPRVRDGEINTVTIRKGFMGSFLLRVNDKGRSVRVKRIK